MHIRSLPLALLAALLALAGVAAAQETVPCPECDEDGEPDDSRYTSIDTGVLTPEGDAIVDTDQSVGENAHGRFTWLQWCATLVDALGHSLSLMFEVFASEDGVDVDATLNVDGEEIDLEDTLVGDVDDATWDAAEPTGAADLLPVSHDDLPETESVDECLVVDELDAQELPLATCG